MLAITDNAAEAIKSLTTDAELPDGGGLRISAPDPDQGLELSLAGQPDADDVVLAGEGVSVFLEPVAAEVLDDKVLDVQPVPGADGEQELRFAIGLQEELPEA
ncbi:adhesin [Pseudonocardia xinjiangensis]|jgi:Fe-S cluster assembly iron-binding protein IscA|uniref:Adhesin n=1 Tax=Pseudonocardia xinjiangensis TaxID=75289 RepID=A0ABX1RLR0_9PSEU|nr:adhesin [Pseudonocardia xinjiangensis]NMH80917.1 adhesin [Pseudonocardia xinjiangensis]